MFKIMFNWMESDTCEYGGEFDTNYQVNDKHTAADLEHIDRLKE